jgi:predicted nucleic acid-binding protein
MAYLLDTNILLRLAQRRHPMHQAARGAVLSLSKAKESLYIVPQNIYEAWVVSTRPQENNGLGLTPEKTERLITRAALFCHLLADTPGVYEEWRSLVTKYSVTGVIAHDVRLVAAMKVHKIEHLLTFNDADFKRFDGKEIAVHSPLTSAIQT